MAATVSAHDGPGAVECVAGDVLQSDAGEKVTELVQMVGHGWLAN